MGDRGSLLAALAARFAEREADFERDDAFNRTALQVHAFQRAANPVLRRFWDGAGAATEMALPSAPRRWQDIPVVPVDAFKEVRIASGAAEAVFRTSGTTGGRARRGEHHVASLDLYRTAARANYRRHLLGGARIRMLALVPSPVAAPDSSLSAMAGFIAQEPEVADAAWAFDPERGIDLGAVAEAAAPGRPVLMLTTAFSLVHLLDRVGDSGMRLPAGSRIMETGGFKGRAARVDRATLYRRVRRVLGVPESHVVNEYGMTEMLSQAYDGRAGAAPPVAERVHRFPAWVRTRALDPEDLSPLPAGRPGLLAHFDLANAASVCHILTADMGATTSDGGVRLLGRARGSELRGCSLTAEAFLRRTRNR